MSNHQKPRYFWCKGQLVEDCHNRVAAVFMDCYCVDTNYVTENAFRYGMFRADRRWKSYLLEEFPPEFRLQLLLLGIS